METLNHSIVKFDKHSKALINDGYKLKRLTVLLKLTLYPSYSYYNAINRVKEKKKNKRSMRLGRGFDRKITETVKLQI